MSWCHRDKSPQHSIKCKRGNIIRLNVHSVLKLSKYRKKKMFVTHPKLRGCLFNVIHHDLWCAYSCRGYLTGDRFRIHSFCVQRSRKTWRDFLLFRIPFLVPQRTVQSKVLKNKKICRLSVMLSLNTGFWPLQSKNASIKIMNCHKI